MLESTQSIHQIQQPGENSETKLEHISQYLNSF